MKRVARVTKIFAGCALALSGFAHAGTFSQNPDPAIVVQGGSAATVQFLFAGDGQTDNAQLDIQLSDVAGLTITANPPLVGGSTCSVIGGNVLRIVPPDASAGGTTLTATPTAYCSFDFTAAAGATLGLRTWTANTVECSALGNPVTPCTFTQTASSGIEISDAPPTPLTLSYAPVPGPITLPSGNAGATVNTNIVATATGNSGSASLSCSAAAGFTVTPNLTFNSAGDQNIAVGCTLGATQTSGNITCTEIDGDSVTPGATRTWTATCPQGGVVPVNPTITTVTATGAFAMPSGALGQTVSRLIDFSASGGAGTGSATINCTATAPVTVTPAMQTVTGSAQPTDVAVRLQLTNAAQGPFDVVCTVTSGSTVRTDTFNVTAAAGTALPPPTVVPASSTWSQLLLIALMAGLGLAFVGFRRQS
jgi:hypothetical protein